MREYLLHWPCNASSKTVSQSTLLRQSETIFYLFLFLFQGKHEFYFTYQILCLQFLICFPTKAVRAFTQQKNNLLWYMVQTPLLVIFIRVQDVLPFWSDFSFQNYTYMSHSNFSSFTYSLILLSQSLLFLIPTTFNCDFSIFVSSFSLLLPERCFEDIPGFLYSILTDRLVIFFTTIILLFSLFPPHFFQFFVLFNAFWNHDTI